MKQGKTNVWQLLSLGALALGGLATLMGSHAQEKIMEETIKNSVDDYMNNFLSELGLDDLDLSHIK